LAWQSIYTNSKSAPICLGVELTKNYFQFIFIFIFNLNCSIVEDDGRAGRKVKY